MSVGVTGWRGTEFSGCGDVSMVKSIMMVAAVVGGVPLGRLTPRCKFEN